MPRGRSAGPAPESARCGFTPTQENQLEMAREEASMVIRGRLLDQHAEHSLCSHRALAGWHVWLVVGVYSAITNSHMRDAIRNTWWQWRQTHEGGGARGCFVCAQRGVPAAILATREQRVPAMATCFCCRTPVRAALALASRNTSSGGGGPQGSRLQ